jgi:hypothetical protein
MPAVSAYLIAIRKQHFWQRQVWKKNLTCHLQALHHHHVTNAYIQHSFTRCAGMLCLIWLGLILTFVCWKILLDLLMESMLITPTFEIKNWGWWICKFLNMINIF